jgi:Holliday junction DNA helicase RuvB
MSKRMISGTGTEEDLKFEATLRPTSLNEFVGQKKVKENLSVFIQAALGRKEALDHILFFGPPGLGKTTLALIIAHELSAAIKMTSGPLVEKPGDLAALLTNLNEGDVLFIDEIHRLPTTVEEVLYPALEDFRLDIIIGQGPSARTMKIPLKHFTLVGATTRSGLLSAPLRSRFGIMQRLDFYHAEDLQTIVKRSASILNVQVEEDADMEIARRSRGTPRIANRLLRRIRDFAEVLGEGIITRAIAADSLNKLEVDQHGLDDIDRKILSILIENFSGGPVGLGTISTAVGEEKDAIEVIYEPFLLQEGFIQRTPRGRIATEKAYKHMNLPKQPPKQGRLF